MDMFRFNKAVTQFNNYQTQYIQPFAKKVTKEYYTKAVWYSLNEFKEYFKYLKKKSTQYNLAITGVDVFFGVYDNDSSLALKSNAQTLSLMASTQKQAIVNVAEKSLYSLSQEDFFAKNNTEETEESLTFNMGQLSPPPRN